MTKRFVMESHFILKGLLFYQRFKLSAAEKYVGKSCKLDFKLQVFRKNCLYIPNSPRDIPLWIVVPFLMIFSLKAVCYFVIKVV